MVKGVFVDTSAWFALAVARDARHPEARRIYEGLREAGTPLETTDWILAETTALLERRVGREAARGMGQGILASPSVRLHCLTAEAVQGAWERYAGAPCGAGLVDCASFVVMESLGVERAFAFDADFAAAGFQVMA